MTTAPSRERLAAALQQALGELCDEHPSCPRDTSRHAGHAWDLTDALLASDLFTEPAGEALNQLEQIAANWRGDVDYATAFMDGWDSCDTGAFYERSEALGSAQEVGRRVGVRAAGEAPDREALGALCLCMYAADREHQPRCILPETGRLAQPDPLRLDPGDPESVARLARAIDAHNEQEEPFSPVHCNSGDDCHVAIARAWKETQPCPQPRPMPGASCSAEEQG